VGIKEREGTNIGGNDDIITAITPLLIRIIIAAAVIIAIQVVVGVSFRTYVSKGGGTYTFERDVCNKLGVGGEVGVERIFFICV
jgi:hypothetical protein